MRCQWLINSRVANRKKDGKHSPRSRHEERRDSRRVQCVHVQQQKHNSKPWPLFVCRLLCNGKSEFSISKKRFPISGRLAQHPKGNKHGTIHERLRIQQRALLTNGFIIKWSRKTRRYGYHGPVACYTPLLKRAAALVIGIRNSARETFAAQFSGPTMIIHARKYLICKTHLTAQLMRLWNRLKFKTPSSSLLSIR